MTIQPTWLPINWFVSCIFFCPIITGAPSVVTQTRREKSRKYCSTHWSTFWHTSIISARPPPVELNTCCSASIPEWTRWYYGSRFFQLIYLISDRRNLHLDSYILLMKPAFFVWGFAGRIAMLLLNRVVGRTQDLRGPDLAREPEVARRWLRRSRCSVDCKGRRHNWLYMGLHIAIHVHGRLRIEECDRG